MATYEYTTTRTIKPGETIFKVKTEEDEKNLKGYQFDSLVYRYIRAREHMAEHEYERDHKHDRVWYFQQAERDIARFIQILDEVIGERT